VDSLRVKKQFGPPIVDELDNLEKAGKHDSASMPFSVVDPCAVKKRPTAFAHVNWPFTA
jgi:hypothetical protein